MDWEPDKDRPLWDMERSKYYREVVGVFTQKVDFLEESLLVSTPCVGRAVEGAST